MAPTAEARSGLGSGSVITERSERDVQGVVQISRRPSRDVNRFGRGGEPVGALVQDVLVARPTQGSLIARARLLTAVEPARSSKSWPRCGLTGEIGSKLRKPSCPSCSSSRSASPRVEWLVRLHLLPERQHEEAVLSDRERQLPA